MLGLRVKVSGYCCSIIYVCVSIYKFYAPSKVVIFPSCVSFFPSITSHIVQLCPPIPLLPPQISPRACFSASSATYRLNFSILLSLGFTRETPTPSVIWPPTALGWRVDDMGGCASS